MDHEWCPSHFDKNRNKWEIGLQTLQCVCINWKFYTLMFRRASVATARTLPSTLSIKKLCTIRTCGNYDFATSNWLESEKKNKKKKKKSNEIGAYILWWWHIFDYLWSIFNKRLFWNFVNYFLFGQKHTVFWRGGQFNIPFTVHFDSLFCYCSSSKCHFLMLIYHPNRVTTIFQFS